MILRMNKTLISMLLLLTVEVFAAPADDFIIRVQTGNNGISNDSSFIIPTIGSGYDYNVDCNDDGINEASALTGDYTCDYSVLGGIGTYTIRIKDNTGVSTGFPRIHFNLTGDVEKVVDLQQWGTGQWQNMAEAFQGATNMLVSATDIPDLTNVTDMSRMFRGNTVANPDTSGWDTSQVTSMTRMFLNATAANPDTSDWDTGLVTDMSLMFRNATAANPDTSDWDTSQVTDMSGMFRDTSAANPDMSNWDVTSLLVANNMFEGVTLPIGTYDALLNNWGNQALRNNVIFTGGNSLYCDGEVARNRMINDFGWVISDGGRSCPISGMVSVPTLSQYMILILIIMVLILTRFVVNIRGHEN